MEKLLELFSGIGGFRRGLEMGGMRFSQVVAVDLNLAANEIYREIYGETVMAKDITSLKTEWFDSVQATVWSMSPPCQPYTRQGLRQDEEDDRANALAHLCDVLESIKIPPKHIFLENVDGFQNSKSYARLRQALTMRGYSILLADLVNPLDLGFPNSRLRFFLVASVDSSLKARLPLRCLNAASCAEKTDQCAFPTLPISAFLDDKLESTDDLMVSLGTLRKPSSVAFDVVAPQSTQSMCFTRGYGRLINGAGSVLYLGTTAESWDERDRPQFNLAPNEMAQLHGKLRYFSATEIARLQGFSSVLPACAIHGEQEAAADFACQFLGENRRGYKTLGNSLNPLVVAIIARSTVQQRRLWKKRIQNPPERPWLDWIEQGKKRFEGRLFKGDWQQVAIGDLIELFSTDKSVIVQVTDLRRYTDFKEAFNDLGEKLVPIEGIDADTVVMMYREYYEDVAEHGVLCVGVSLP
jgi:tRNA (cytosine38-C5)-methyltransferase